MEEKTLRTVAGMQQHSGLSGCPPIPEYFAKILKNKDRIIRVQAKRIEILEGEVERLRVSRETLSSQLALLSYKLDLATRPTCGQVSGAIPVTSLQSQSPSSKCTGEEKENSKTSHASSDGRSATCTSAGNNAGQQSSPQEKSGNVAVTSGSGETSLSKLNGNDAGHQAVDDAALAKDVEELAAKYGGYLRAKRAATIIQQTFRQYTMSRSFAKLRLEAGESRRSRRFGRHRCSNSQAEQTLVEGQNVAGQTAVQGDLGREINVDGFSTHSKLFPPLNATDTVDQIALDYPVDLSAIGKQSSLSDDALNGLNGIDDRPLSDDGDSSSRSLSPLLPPPMSGSGDLPSVCFESSLEDEGSFNQQRIAGYGSSDGISSFSSLFPLLESNGNETVGSEKNCNSYGIPHLGNLHFVNDGVMRNDQNTRNSGNCGHHSVALSCRGDRSAVSSDCSRRTGACTADLMHGPSFTRFGVTSVHSGMSPIWKRKSSSVESGCEGYDSVGGLAGNWIEEVCEQQQQRRLRNNGNERPWSDLYPGSTTSSEDANSISSGGCSNDIPVIPASSLHHVAHHRPGVDCGGHEHRPSCTANTSAHTRSSTYSHISDKQRKRSYRIGLNLFNKNPEVGLRFLVSQRFVDNSATAVARFLVTRKGLSKQKIGEYLGNLQQRFNMDVLGCFSEEIDLSGMQIDDALRKFQSHFRMPGEAQKIERLMEAFAGCYCECNPEIVRRFRRADTVFLLAFAIIMLNTDLHNKSIKPERKMKLEDFVRNLRGIDGGADIDRDILAGIYDRTIKTPFRPVADHVTQVMKVESMIVGKRPVLAVPHRRLVCYCRLYEVQDPNKRDRGSGQHQREVFLFNDMLMVTKSASKKKDSVMYSFRQCLPLCGMIVYIFETTYYQYGIQLSDSQSKVLATFCARNERDRTKFVEDLKEAILEMNEMSALESADDIEGASLSDRGSHHSSSSSVIGYESHLTAASCRSVPECDSGVTTSSLGNISEGDHHGSSASLDSGLPSSGSGSTGSYRDAGHSGKQPPPTQDQPPSSNSKFNLFAKKNRANKLSPACNVAEF